MKKNLGILLIVLGSFILLMSYTLDHFNVLDLVDQNWVQMVALLAIIGGLVAHIIVSRKQPVE